jgi:hypothetical protein
MPAAIAFPAPETMVRTAIRVDQCIRDQFRVPARNRIWQIIFYARR